MNARQPLPASPQMGCSVLLQCYSDEAGAEALLRAFMAERNRDRVGARFWTNVYRLIVQAVGESRKGD